jgi:hypothetical protein
MEQQGMETDEIVDVEEYAKAGKPVPSAKKYRIRIEKEHYTVEVPSMTGRQLLELAKKTPPNGYQIRQKLRGGEVRKIGLDEETRFDAPGVERYVTLPLDQTEG